MQKQLSIRGLVAKQIGKEFTNVRFENFVAGFYEMLALSGI